MAVTAVTGEIGSGKSTAARILAEKLGCVCFDADRVAKGCWLCEDVKAQAASRWGSEILNTSGQLIIPKLAEHIFSSKSEHDFCSSLIHPIVMQGLRELAQNHSDSVLEIPLLPEAGRPDWIDRVIYVAADFAVRAERCRVQRGWSVEELRRRESYLLPQNVRMSVCEVVIHNDGGINELAELIEAAIQHISVNKHYSLNTNN